MEATQSPLSAFSDILEGRATAAGLQASKNYDEAYATPKVSGNDAFMAGLIALAPLIAGALKGKKGLRAGAAGGLAGIKALDASLTEDQTRKQAGALAQAKLAAQNQKSLQDKAISADLEGMKSQERRSLEMDKLKEKKRLGLGGGVTVKLPPGYEGIGEAQAAKIQEALDIYGDSVGVVDNVNDIIERTVAAGGPDFKKESILGKDRKIDFGKALDLMGTWAKSETRGGEDPRTNIINMINAWADKYNKVITGAAQTDTEFKRRYGTIIQKGALQVTPSTIPVILDMIQYLGGTYRSKAEQRYQSASVLTEKGISPAERRSRFNQLLAETGSGKFNPAGYGAEDESAGGSGKAPDFYDILRNTLSGGR